jgi:hypothetical protein
MYMKRKNSLRQVFQHFMLACFAAFVTVLSYGQESGGTVDININKKESFWASPWVWVVGGAVFVLLLAAILRGGGSRKDA